MDFKNKIINAFNNNNISIIQAFKKFDKDGDQLINSK